ncbi:MAG: hypothetical protein OXG68_05675 [Chloroflexi bacterium]|nr:hypothetical protein [Chloroflexota bacterium]
MKTFKQTVSFLFVVVMFFSFAGQSLGSDIDQNADPNSQASQAIALAESNGHDVSLTVEELAGLIRAIESASFAVDADDDSESLTNGGSRRYKCSATEWYVGNQLTVNWWADTTVQNGVIVRINSSGWNYTWLPIVPTFDAVVSATATATILDSGRKIELRLDGTVKYYFAGILLSTRALNLKGTKHA